MTSNVGLVFAAGIALSFVLWAADVAPLELLLVALVAVSIPVMLVVLLVQRIGTHPCPRCGNRVNNGQINCGVCGFSG